MGEQLPRPKSPPGYVDLYGKRRQQVMLQVLEREIGFLQEELKMLETVQPTSRCCKELNEFIATRQDPLITLNQKPIESDCSWRTISGCYKADDAQHQLAKKTSSSRCCCLLRSPKCCGTNECSCFHQSCCSFKLCCSGNCSKVKLCPNCVRGYCGSC